MENWIKERLYFLRQWRRLGINMYRPVRVCEQNTAYYLKEIIIHNNYETWILYVINIQEMDFKENTVNLKTMLLHVSVL
jgi:hypothetical protein